MRCFRQIFRWVAALGTVVVVITAAANAVNKAYLVEVSGAIGPVTQELILVSWPHRC